MSANWLVDTNVVSEMMLQHPEPNVIRYLDAVRHEGLILSVISVWEILNGIGKLPLGQRRADLNIAFSEVLIELFNDRVVDWTLADSRMCAQIMEHKRRIGEELDAHWSDAFLAATAVNRGFTMLTRNLREFRNTGVVAVDPWIERP